MNLLKARVVGAGTGVVLESEEGWRYELSAANARKAVSGSGEVVLGARHSTIRLYKEAAPGRIPGRVYTVEPTGDITYAHVLLGSAIIIVSVAPEVRLGADDQVWIEFNKDKLHLFDGKTGQVLSAA